MTDYSFTLVTSGTPGNDVNLDPNRIEGEWRFVNKIWQMANFITANLGDEQIPAGLPARDELDLPSRWILSRLNQLIRTVQRLFDTYQYGEAGRQIRSFLWDEFADWYIEMSKHALYSDDTTSRTHTLQMLVHVMDTSMRLLHPFMPFATEEIWRYLPHSGEALIIAQWPQADADLIDDEAENKMNVLMDMVRGIRATRIEYDVDPGHKVAAQIAPGSFHDIIEAHSYLFARLCNVPDLEVLTNGSSAPEDAASIVVSDVTVYLPLAGMIDIEAEVGRLSKDLERLSQQIEKTHNMLANEQFVSRARPEVVQRERDRLVELEASSASIRERLDQLTSKR